MFWIMTPSSAYPEHKSSWFLWNISNHLEDYVLSWPKDQKVIFCVMKAPYINQPLLLLIPHPHVITLIPEDEVAGSSKMAVAVFLQHT